MTAFDAILTFAEEDPILTGGIIAMIIAFVVGLARARVYKFFAEEFFPFLIRQIESSIEIDGSGPFFEAFSKWAEGESSTIFWRREVFSGETDWELLPDPEGMGPGVNMLKVNMEFGPGSKFLMMYKNRPVYIRYGKEEEGNRIYNKFYISSFFMSVKSLEEFVNWVSASHAEEDDTENDMIGVFKVGRNASWEHSVVRKKPEGSVIIRKEIKDRLFKYIDDFRSNREKYIRTGAPYRTGVLLYGPPGVGKTSIVQMVASQYDMNIYIIPIGSKNMDDDKLESLVSGVGWNSIVLFEDVDAADCAQHRGTSTPAIQDGKISWGGEVTLTGLLNVLDGVGSREGVIYVMTTNFPEKLDPALLREGRTDMKIFIDNASKDQIRLMFEKFFPALIRNEPTSLGQEWGVERLIAMAVEFSELFGENKESMAAIQAHLISNWSSPQKAIDSAREKLEKNGTVADALHSFKVENKFVQDDDDEFDQDDDAEEIPPDGMPVIDGDSLKWNMTPPNPPPAEFRKIIKRMQDGKSLTTAEERYLREYSKDSKDKDRIAVDPICDDPVAVPSESARKIVKRTVKIRKGLR